jgi:hypothetical protein
MMSKILQVQHRRVLSRQKATLYLATFVVLLYLFFQRSQRAQYQVWRQAVDLRDTILGGAASTQSTSEEIQWAPAPTVDQDAPQLSEDDLKELFKQEYNDLGK